MAAPPAPWLHPDAPCIGVNTPCIGRNVSRYPGRRLGDNLSRTDVEWGEPSGVPVSASVHEWFQHLLVRRLRALGYDAEALAQATGATESTWRSKFNGTRRITLLDIIEVVLSVDADILTALPTSPTDLTDLVPPAHAGWLSHTETGSGMPHFRRPAPTDPIRQLAALFDAWLLHEYEVGNEWVLTRDVVVHALVTHARDAGLDPATLTLGQVTDDFVDLECVADGVVLRLIWQEPFHKPSADGLREQLLSVARSLWGLTANGAENRLVAHAAHTTTRRTFRKTCALTTAGTQVTTTDSVVLSLTQARRLGLSSPLDLPDVHIRSLTGDASGSVDWYQVK